MSNKTPADYTRKMLDINDDIDNAVWEAIRSIGEKDEAATLQLISEAVDALNNYRAIEELLPYEEALIMLRQIKNDIQEYLTNTDHTELPDWDMEIIGEVTDNIEERMLFNGIPVCHPYFTESDEGDEVPCYRAGDCHNPNCIYKDTKGTL